MLRRKADGSLDFSATAEAIKHAKENVRNTRSKNSQRVLERAYEECHKSGLSTSKQNILLAHEIQFGKYANKTFRWLLTNDLGYCVYLASELRTKENEAKGKKKIGDLDANMISFYECCKAYPELMTEVDRRTKMKTGLSSQSLLNFGKHPDWSLGDCVHPQTSEVADYVKWMLKQEKKEGSRMEAVVKWIEAARRDWHSDDPVSDADLMKAVETSTLDDPIVADAISTIKSSLSKHQLQQAPYEPPLAHNRYDGRSSTSSGSTTAATAVPQKWERQGAGYIQLESTLFTPPKMKPMPKKSRTSTTSGPTTASTTPSTSSGSTSAATAVPQKRKRQEAGQIQPRSTLLTAPKMKPLPKESSVQLITSRPSTTSDPTTASTAISLSPEPQDAAQTMVQSTIFASTKKTGPKGGQCIELSPLDPKQREPPQKQSKLFAQTTPRAETTQGPPAISERKKSPTADSDRAPGEVLSAMLTRRKRLPSVTGKPFPDRWGEVLCADDLDWLAKKITVIDRGQRVLRPNLPLWVHPQNPSLKPNGVPRPAPYFRVPVLCWFPRSSWGKEFPCPSGRHTMVGGGRCRSLREVLDIKGYYILATEILVCRTAPCNFSVTATQPYILEKLSDVERDQLPAILTKRHACDKKVITMLRERTLGNSPTAIMNRLQEAHSEDWLQRMSQYLTACETLRIPLMDPPTLKVLPHSRWLTSVYIQDVVQRLPDSLSSITSVTGTILKIDSTKKFTKKLYIRSAQWCTNVANERGEILQSVLTVGEGRGLSQMCADLVRRFTAHQEPPPKVIYVDRDCCKQSGSGILALKSAFLGWPDIEVRLDIWHFMRRFGDVCTTEAHPLYAVFLRGLSRAIFVWMEGDVEQLVKAKAAEERSKGSAACDIAVIRSQLGRLELARHCRRCTRGVEEVTASIEHLVDVFESDSATDELGVRLFRHGSLREVWDKQRKHVPCIQDPPGVTLYYEEPHRITRGGIQLPVYKCARGTTSLEGFHNHIVRFVPGTFANDQNFHAFHIEGILRWNANRAREWAAPTSHLRCYSDELVRRVEGQARSLLGKGLEDILHIPNIIHRQKRVYTGEKIGLDYLYSQTNKAMVEFSRNAQGELDLDEEIDIDFSVSPLVAEEPQPAIDDLSDFQLPSMERRLNTDELPNQPAEEIVEHPTNESNIVGSSDFRLQPKEKCLLEAQSEPPETDAMDRRGVGGLGQVEEVVTCLFSLLRVCKETDRYSLSNEQAQALYVKVQNLDQRDCHSNFSPRGKAAKPYGKFKRTKGGRDPEAEICSKVSSSDSASATFPDANRIMSTIFHRLLDIHGKKHSRWDLILTDYGRLRHMVNGHPLLRTDANDPTRKCLQLANVNLKTLKFWHQKEEKNQAREVLESGLHINYAPMTTLTKHTEARPKKYLETASASHDKPTTVTSAPSTSNFNIGLVPLLPMPTTPTTQIPNYQVAPAQLPTSYQTLYARKRREEGRPPVTKQKGKNKTIHRSKPYNNCSKCGHPSRDITGHKRSKGKVFCPFTEKRSFDEWKKDIQ